MAFTLPQFNCLFNSWRLDPTGTFWSRIQTNHPCQWYVNPRILAIDFAVSSSEEVILHFLRVPIGTDIDEGDLVEVEPGSERFYELLETERVHLNFPNEYAVGYANNVDAVNTPFVISTEDGIQLQTETVLPLFTELY